MNKKKLDILERALTAEIDAAFGSGIGLLQTRSKDARELEEMGYLESVMVERGVLVMRGYRLTHSGRYLYGSSTRCRDVEAAP